MKIVPIPAFQSNYFWSIEDDGSAAIVDPGDATPVINHMEQNKLDLKFILITHHHPDHTGGIRELKKYYPNCKVYGPANERISLIDEKLSEGNTVELGNLGQYKILDIPGHTAGHIAYHDDKSAFVGDTVFAVGCGRLFEGSPTQMIDSFDKIKKLPMHIKLYCAHEYTLSNIEFAKAVEPQNKDLLDFEIICNKLRRESKPTVPSTLENELNTNPFLRCTEPDVIEAAEKRASKTIQSEVEVFATLRSWKDGF